MGNFTFLETKLPGVILVETSAFSDSRGFFMETYHQREFETAGIDAAFVQDNHSASVKGVLRGLHFQKGHPQGKLVRAVYGEIFDVAVDLRPGSPTLGQWCGEFLSAENRRQLYVPQGFAHGFLVLSERAEFAYKCTDFYTPGDEYGLMWNDPEIGISWPLDPGEEPILADKDRKYPSLGAWMEKEGILS